MKKFWKLGFALLPAVIGAACLAACGDTEHTHTFQDGWTNDGNEHWHSATCEHTEETDGRAPHSFEVVKSSDQHWQECTVCHYKKDEGAHVYEFNYDGDHHWQECTFCGDKKDEEAHALVEGACDCGYVDPAQRIVYTLIGNEYEVSLSAAALNDRTFTSFEIPEEYEGKKVRKIAENGFNGAKYLKEITIPKTVWYIGDYAFGDCAALTGITLPATLQELGNQVFSGCKELAGTVVIPSNITVIGENLFLNCEKLQGVTFAEGTTRIGTQAFANCKSLIAIEIPETVEYIGLKAFKGTGLTEVSVPVSVTTLCAYAFQDCTALTTATVNANVEYATGAWFKGCTALETLTLPFVGQDVYPLEVSASALGFAFGTENYGTAETVQAVEQDGVTYYMPKSLKALTVLGGYIKSGAFDNCSMLGNVTLKEAVTAETDTFENCTANFTVEFTASVKNLQILKDEASVNTAHAGETLALSYETTKFATVTVAVTKGDAAATESDYTYNKENHTIVFNTVGNYTVTVIATTGAGEPAQRAVTIEITLPAPELSEITLDPATAELTAGGTVETTLSFTADEESEISVVVKKDGVAVEGVYDEASKKITVNAVGVYTIEVTATRNGQPVTKTAIFSVSNAEAVKPEITLSATSATVAEGTGSTLTVSVNYPEGATKKNETFTFAKLNGSAFENADANDYEWNEETKTFTPKVAGTYQIKLSALTEEGGEAEQTVTVTATVAEITLSLTTAKTNGWVRAVADTETEIVYEVTGYAGGYNVTFEKSVDAASIAAASGKTAVNVSFGEPDTVTFKVIYTHKTDATKKVELEIPVSFVSSADAPVLGEDPFGGTYSTLVTSTGLMLYFNVIDGANQISAENVSFACVDQSALKDLKADGKVTVTKVNGLDNQWFALIEDFDGDNNKANGQISIKLTATVDGKTAAATKVFEVKPVATDNQSEITKYMKAVLGENFQSNVQFIGNSGIRQNMIVSKTGIIHHRSGGWDMGGDALRFDLNKITAQDSTQTFQIDFKFTSLKGNNMELSFGFRTGNWDGWAGSLGYRPNWDGGDNKANEMQVQGWLKNPSNQDASGSFEVDAGKVPTVTAGTTFFGRVTRTLDGDNNVIYKAYYSVDGTAYNQLCEYNVGTSSLNGRAAKYVYALQIGFGGNNGYYLENLKITSPVT